MKRPRLVRLDQPQGDDGMAERLLWILGFVRAGKVKGFSICMLVESGDGGEVVLESAEAVDDFHEMALLGAMRTAEHDLIERRRAREDES